MSVAWHNRNMPKAKPLKKITDAQKKTGGMIRKAPFKRFLQYIDNEARFAKEAEDLIRELAESYVVNMLAASMNVAGLNGRKTVMKRDLQATRDMRDKGFCGGMGTV